MRKYRIYTEYCSNGNEPITVHWVQVWQGLYAYNRWLTIKGFEDYGKARQLLDTLNEK